MADDLPSPADSDPIAGDEASHAQPANPLVGKLVILLIFGVTLAMAVFAVWYRSAASRRARAAFGIEHAQRIQLAKQIYFARLQPASVRISLDALPPDEQWMLATKISGMTHVQGALMEDRSFDWDVVSECQPQWECVLRFVDEQGQMTHLAIDLNCDRLRLLETSEEFCYSPMATFLHRFVRSLYGDGESNDSATPSTSESAPDRLSPDHAEG